MMSVILKDWLREEEARKLRESRIFAQGFWAGSAMMGAVAIAVLVVALATR